MGLPRRSARLIFGRRMWSRRDSYAQVLFGRVKHRSALPRIFGSGFWCGSLSGFSRNRGRGWNRLRGGSRPVCRSRCAGRTTRSPAPHRRPESIRGWSAKLASERSHCEMTPWCALYGFEQRTFVRPLIRASDFSDRRSPNHPPNGGNHHHVQHH